MQSFQFCSRSGQEYNVTLPDPKPGLKSAFVFAFARSGSTLLNNMVTDYCKYIDAPTFSLFNTAFDQGIPTQDIMKDTSVCFVKSGYIYTGFRHFPAFGINIDGVPAAWLVRDPRDMLVSLYYSIRKSHVIPRGQEFFRRNREQAQKMGIDQFVITKAKIFVGQFEWYKEALAGSDVKIYRYEDFIYKKEEWLTDVVAKLGLQHNSKLVRDVASRFDIIPNAENENEHVRQVHPGNYTTKLTDRTIRTLNESLSGFLKYFRYES